MKVGGVVAHLADDAALFGHTRCRIGQPEGDLTAGDPAVRFDQPAFGRDHGAGESEPVGAQFTDPVLQRLDLVNRRAVVERQRAERVQKRFHGQGDIGAGVTGERHQRGEGGWAAKDFGIAPALVDGVVVVFPDENETGMRGEDRF